MPDAPAPPRYDLDVSVIIPALEAMPHALRIVRLLAEQSHDFSFEILLVLNHEEREIEAELPARARILFCPERGAFFARNAGIRAARGRVLAFTDSDCTPTSSWLSEGYKAVRTHDYSGLVAGRIAPYYGRKTDVAIFESAFSFRQDRYVAAGFGATGNLWVPADIVRTIRAFDPAMLGAGDVEFGLRARAAGIPIFHAPESVVGHECRTGLLDLLAKERRLAGGEVLLTRSTSLSGHRIARLDDEWRWAKRRYSLIRSAHPGARGLRLQAISLLVLLARAGEKILVRAGKRPLRH